MIIIGEKLNGTIPSMAKAIANRDEEWIKEIARKEADAGADFIDVCASVEVGEVETLHWMIDLVQSVTSVPICIDSPSTEVLAQAYGFCKKPGMFNSVSMESKKQIDGIFKIMAENPGWEVIAMLCDDTGIPKSAADRLRVFEAIMEKAKAYGIDPSRIHIDPIIEAAALMDPDREDGPGIAINTKVIRAIRAAYPTIHITSAISNISHGLPARKFMNYAFTALVLEAGLDSGILDPLNEGMLGVIYAAEALLGLDEDGYCMEYIEAYKDGLFGASKK